MGTNEGPKVEKNEDGSLIPQKLASSYYVLVGIGKEIPDSIRVNFNTETYLKNIILPSLSSGPLPNCPEKLSLSSIYGLLVKINEYMPDDVIALMQGDKVVQVIQIAKEVAEGRDQ